MPRKINSLLTPIRYSHKNKYGQSFWLYKCLCGNTKVTLEYSVRVGKTKSCGHLQKEAIRKLGKSLKTHGESEDCNPTSEYRAWHSMKTRCYRVKNHNYKWYGQRGIKVCKRWLNSYTNFLKDMGRKPSSKHSLDRIDNNKGYSPSNCKWSTILEQNYNRSVKYASQTGL